MSGATRTPRARRFDPDRRDRILAACLNVIESDGVAGVSHRKVAAVADVPLGSMTYHFDGMDALLFAAFGAFAAEADAGLADALAAAASPEVAREVLVEHITDRVLVNRRALVLTTELYALAARDERYRAITGAWMARSRAALERRFDAPTAALLDALTEGLTLHRALDDGRLTPADVRLAVARVSRPQSSG
ncbi:MAG: TetR family transcriptional regulator [Propionibacteriaceae bacterium]|nr:TetR family transcriptional regulator [Propionibacteriaceae bacterium]